jgi:cyclohexyl-isocyanide hydratase
LPRARFKPKNGENGLNRKREKFNESEIQCQFYHDKISRHARRDFGGRSNRRFRRDGPRGFANSLVTLYECEDFLEPAAQNGAQNAKGVFPMSSPLQIGFLVFPSMLQLDFTGPYGVLAAGPETAIHLVWKDTLSVTSSDGLRFTPTVSMADCPRLDVVCVPGGGGIQTLLGDAETLEFLRRQAAGCRYLCSVCTGALVLGAAGLLRGYRATTHWQSLDLLPLFGAVPQRRRVVLDRNRISAAGVSAGIDMALTLAGLLWGDATAQGIQLNMEYAPEPPYASGTPDSAPKEVTAALKTRTASRRAARREASQAAAALLDAGVRETTTAHQGMIGLRHEF